MYALIRKWEQSGLSQAKFFSEHKISKSTFGYWRKKYLRIPSYPFYQPCLEKFHELK